MLTEQEFYAKFPYGTYGGYVAMKSEQESIAKYGRTIPVIDNEGFLAVARENELIGASND